MFTGNSLLEKRMVWIEWIYDLSFKLMKIGNVQEPASLTIKWMMWALRTFKRKQSQRISQRQSSKLCFYKSCLNPLVFCNCLTLWLYMPTLAWKMRAMFILQLKFPSIDPLYSNINIHILRMFLFTIPILLTWRICLTIRSFLN